jgi:hypothetical protein
MDRFIAFYGLFALFSAIAAGVLAGFKRRDHSFWAAWTFIVPPMLILLVLMPKNEGPRPRRPSFDDDDHKEAA